MIDVLALGRCPHVCAAASGVVWTRLGQVEVAPHAHCCHFASAPFLTPPILDPRTPPPLPVSRSAWAVAAVLCARRRVVGGRLPRLASCCGTAVPVIYSLARCLAFLCSRYTVRCLPCWRVRVLVLVQHHEA